MISVDLYDLKSMRKKLNKRRNPNRNATMMPKKEDPHSRPKRVIRRIEFEKRERKYT